MEFQRDAEAQGHALEGPVVARRPEPADGEHEDGPPRNRAGDLPRDGVQLVAHHDGAPDHAAEPRDEPAQTVAVGVDDIAAEHLVARRHDLDRRRPGRGSGHRRAASIRGERSGIIGRSLAEGHVGPARPRACGDAPESSRSRE